MVTELTLQIHRASMSHSLMNGFSAILPALADKNDAEIEHLKAENTKLRKLLRQAIYAKDDADWASIVSVAIGLGVEVK